MSNKAIAQITENIIREMYQNAFQSETRWEAEQELGEVEYKVEVDGKAWAFRELKATTSHFLTEALDYNPYFTDVFNKFVDTDDRNTDWLPRIYEFMTAIGVSEDDYDTFWTDHHDVTVPFTAVVWEDDEIGEWMCLLWLRHEIFVTGLCKPRAFTLLPVNGRGADTAESTLNQIHYITFLCGSDPRSHGDQRFMIEFLNDSNPSNHSYVTESENGLDGDPIDDMVALDLDAGDGDPLNIGNVNRTIKKYRFDRLKNVRYFLPIKDGQFRCPNCEGTTVAFVLD